MKGKAQDLFIYLFIYLFFAPLRIATNLNIFFSILKFDIEYKLFLVNKDFYKI